LATTNDLRNGMHFEYDGDILEVVEFQHVKPGKGPAFVRAKVRNMRSGAIVERTYRAGEKVIELRLEARRMEYLYNDGTDYVFMDQKSFDQISIAKDQLGEKVNFLMENLAIEVQMYGGEILGIELPQFLDIEIAYTEPGERGNTVSGTTKKAQLATGAVIQVPLFIETGNVVKVDTHEMRYIERVSK
jgi:elongation factor P